MCDDYQRYVMNEPSGDYTPRKKSNGNKSDNTISTPLVAILTILGWAILIIVALAK